MLAEIFRLRSNSFQQEINSLLELWAESISLRGDFGEMPLKVLHLLHFHTLPYGQSDSLANRRIRFRNGPAVRVTARFEAGYEPRCAGRLGGIADIL